MKNEFVRSIAVMRTSKPICSYRCASASGGRREAMKAMNTGDNKSGADNRAMIAERGDTNVRKGAENGRRRKRRADCIETQPCRTTFGTENKSGASRNCSQNNSTQCQGKSNLCNLNVEHQCQFLVPSPLTYGHNLSQERE